MLVLGLAGILVVLIVSAFRALNPSSIERIQALFQGLPADVREEIAGDLDELLGARFDGLSEAGVVAESARITRSGLARLDDEQLIRRLELQTLALGRVTTAECAAFMRAGFAGSPDIEAGEPVIASFSEDERIEWYRITAAAMRAELTGSPKPRTVDEAAFQGAFAVIAASWSSDEVDLVERVGAAPAGVSDDEVCRFVGLVYGRIDLLTREDLAIVARYDVTAIP